MHKSLFYQKNFLIPDFELGMMGAPTAIKIVTCVNGQLLLHEERLKNILDAAKGGEEEPELVILSAVGTPNNEKTMLINLCLQFFQKKGRGGWMNYFSKGKQIDGFPWGDERQPEEPEDCIWMWSQPFLVDADSGKSYVVFLLDVSTNMKTGGADEMFGPMEAFASLVSSTVLVNRSCVWFFGKLFI